MIEDATCKYKVDCPFYGNFVFNSIETQFYFTYCVNEGKGCGLKNHKDLTEKLKDGKT